MKQTSTHPARVMRTAAVALIIALALAGCATTISEQPAPQPQVRLQARIVALGDSITRGAGVEMSQAYPAQLERLLRQDGLEYNVTNMGRDGDTSAGALARIDEVIAQEPDIVIVEIGINDGLRREDPAVIERNIDGIVAALRARGIDVLLVDVPQEKIPQDAYGRSFAGIYGRVAARHNITVVPLLAGVIGDPQMNLADGVHPNEQGHAAMASSARPYIQAWARGAISQGAPVPRAAAR